jgi:uncharacterized protein
LSEKFVDTGYLVAILLPDDMLHEAALAFAELIPSGTRLVTSELVLVELLNYVSSIDPIVRNDAAKIWSGMLLNPLFTVIPTSSDLMTSARTLYEKFSDKKWSLTDCASFIIMRDRKIADALTHDHHFEQAGFRVLL